MSARQKYGVYQPFIAILVAAALISPCAAAQPVRGRHAPNRAAVPQVSLLNQFRPIGGFGNNLVNPGLDVLVGNPELIIAPLLFAPNTNDGLISATNARTISNVIGGGTGAQGQTGQTTDPTLSAWLYVFGQFVDHDLDLEETPQTNAAINITIPAGDPVFSAGTVIAMNRDTRSNKTNTIINTVAGYLDLSQLYGSTQAVASALINSDGTLTSSDNGLALPVQNGSFVTGDPRVMENPELTAVTTLFLREHNFWVATLKAQHPNWSAGQLYNMAKAINTAEYENIVYTEYLPALLGNVLGPYRGYDPSVNSQVTQEFSTSAFRVGHSQVSDTQEGLDNNGNAVFTEALAQGFFNTPATDISNGIDPLLRSLGSDFSQATDPYTVAALRNLLFAGLVGGDIDEIDLIAIDIQRERDAGVNTLNQTRRALGLRPYGSFAELTPDANLQSGLQSVFGSIDNVDLFIGGLAEPHATGANVGPTFQLVIGDQFQRLRAGDRFFWLNEGFDRSTASTIAATTLTTLMERDTNTTANLQANLFIERAVVGPQVAPHVKVHVPLPSIDGHRPR